MAAPNIEIELATVKQNVDMVKTNMGGIEKTVQSHEEKINLLERNDVELRVEIKNLCANLKQFTSVLKWFIGIWVTSLLSFFLWYLQSK